MYKVFLTYLFALHFFNLTVLFPVTGNLIGYFVKIEQLNSNNFLKSLGEIAEEVNEENESKESLHSSRKRIINTSTAATFNKISQLSYTILSVQAERKTFYADKIIPPSAQLLLLFRLTPF